MQLKRLDSTTQPRAIDAADSLRQPHGEQIRRVEALAAVENNRQRSLRSRKWPRSMSVRSGHSKAARRSCRKHAMWRLA